MSTGTLIQSAICQLWGGGCFRATDRQSMALDKTGQCPAIFRIYLLPQCAVNEHLFNSDIWMSCVPVRRWHDKAAVHLKITTICGTLERSGPWSSFRYDIIETGFCDVPNFFNVPDVPRCSMLIQTNKKRRVCPIGDQWTTLEQHWSRRLRLGW